MPPTSGWGFGWCSSLLPWPAAFPYRATLSGMSRIIAGLARPLALGSSPSCAPISVGWRGMVSGSSGGMAIAARTATSRWWDSAPRLRLRPAIAGNVERAWALRDILARQWSNKEDNNMNKSNKLAHGVVLAFFGAACWL